METWSYQDKKFFDMKGQRWHFMFCHHFVANRPPEEQPYLLYFRDDQYTFFGVLKYEHMKDNPYRNLETITRKIMNDVTFRKMLRDDCTKEVWRNK